MATKFEDYKFDARPDRIDIRDLTYRPPLVSLPTQFPSQDWIDQNLERYCEALILDQGTEGACTGFGLATVINYLLWVQAGDREKQDNLTRVSTRMLYRMARLYDEWPGEDYEGSSCRGAMKGWHRHGVCTDELWPYRAANGVIRYLKPKSGWQEDAALRPLGAYYRINKDSIVDMQAAVSEVGAIYVSAMVHDGWDNLVQGTMIPCIAEPKDPANLGGHAFAVVGYTEYGFIVQNSWGANWGLSGFALLPYSDWVRHGTDAWVAVMGAPMKSTAGTRSTRTRTSVSLADQTAGKASWSWRSESAGKEPGRDAETQPLNEDHAYQHTVVLGNNGRPINPYLDIEDEAGAIREAACQYPMEWLRAKASRKAAPKLAIYAHGGLNDQAASLNRIRVMAPYFIANDVYPLFITWRTGFIESISGILEDAVERFFGWSGEALAQGWLSDLKHQVSQARDRSIEVASEKLLVKPVWAQMKQNAAAAADPRVDQAGLHLVAGQIEELKKKVPALEIHLVGHSAGSILLGHLLSIFKKKELSVSTLSLYAPACTVGFAVQHYIRAVPKVVVKNNIFVDLLSDERERADSVGPYGKSLLYLVSRALEDVHKMPLLGMQRAWSAKDDEGMWHEGTSEDLIKWRKFAAGPVSLDVHSEEHVRVAEKERIPLAHGSFDNDVTVLARTLGRIRGAALLKPVSSLKGF